VVAFIALRALNKLPGCTCQYASVGFVKFLMGVIYVQAYSRHLTSLNV
jgi:hypothetical protein